jgi:hypothetical protein
MVTIMNSTLKKCAAIAFLLVITTLQASMAQEIAYDLSAFKKIVVSPKINLILEKGDRESIRLTYANVSPDKINIQVRHKTLRLFLDDARVTERNEKVGWYGKRSIYNEVIITAYVTYIDLEHLEIRGNQELTCNGPIQAEKFTLRAYGENEVRLSSVKTAYLKTSLYGENKLVIKGGKAQFQKYRLYGQNHIDSRELKSFATAATSYGESKIKLNTQDNLRISAFGESRISYLGNASINRGLIFGDTKINKAY